MIGVCPECGGTVRGKKCTACGWTQYPEAEKSKGEYQHSPLRRCSWLTDGAQCHLPASLSITEWCVYHRWWAEQRNKAGLDQRAVFSRWLADFLTSYGHAPGPFGHEEGQIWLALTGVCNVPVVQGNAKRGVVA